MKDNQVEREKFTNYMMSRLNYNITEKDKDDQEMDVIISKKMLEHMKGFFKEDKDDKDKDMDMGDDSPTLTKKNMKSKSFKKKQTRKNRTMKKN
jgi:hypothetical protein